jgi:hypothetical protein
MPIIYVDWITRGAARSQPTSIFIFGDNAAGFGLRGQAAELRGEPNAIGIPTKWKPGGYPKAYFSDDQSEAWVLVSRSLVALQRYLQAGVDCFAPTAGVGTGFSHLPEKAPAIYRAIWHWFNDRASPCPWPKSAATEEDSHDTEACNTSTTAGPF